MKVCVYAVRNNAIVEVSQTELASDGHRLSLGADGLVLAYLLTDSRELKVEMVVTNEDAVMASGSPYLVVEPESPK